MARLIIEDMEEEVVMLEEVVFEAGLVIILAIMIIGIERILGLGDSPDQKKEE